VHSRKNNNLSAVPHKKSMLYRLAKLQQEKGHLPCYIPAVQLPRSPQSDEERKVMDIVDKLRRKGLSSVLELQQPVVCGDQPPGRFIGSCLYRFGPSTSTLRASSLSTFQELLPSGTVRKSNCVPNSTEDPIVYQRRMAGRVRPGEEREDREERGDRHIEEEQMIE
jgi:hypothetical protein